MTVASYTRHIHRIFCVLNLLWYLLLSPLFISYMLLYGSGLKEWLLIVYQYMLNSISILVWPKTVVVTNSISRTADSENKFSLASDSDWLPLTVFLGFCYTPFYLYTMISWSTHDFLQWNVPFMLVFTLMCGDESHYDAHLWLTRRHQSVWYRRLISSRFKQYTQMIWYPISQHLPHVYIHHKFNMKNQQDTDYVGCYRRDGLKDFFTFVSMYEWNTIRIALEYFPTRSTSQALMWSYIKDLILNYGLLLLAACCGWQKFLFQYVFHCLCYYIIAWYAFYVEHAFHHTINDSYKHHWNIVTMVSSTTKLSTESHTAHHIWPAQSSERNAAWANNPVEFAMSQLEYRHLAIACNSTYEEVLYMPYLMITKQYSRLAQMLYFKDCDQLKAAGMMPHLIQAYQDFQKQCDGAEIKRRLQPH